MHQFKCQSGFASCNLFILLMNKWDLQDLQSAHLKHLPLSLSWVCMHLCMCTCVHVCACMCVCCVCMYVCACMHVCLCLCVHVCVAGNQAHSLRPARQVVYSEFPPLPAYLTISSLPAFPGPGCTPYLLQDLSSTLFYCELHSLALLLGLSSSRYSDTYLCHVHKIRAHWVESCA